MAKNKVLILGGNGFIGSHLSDSLAEDGFDVIALDKYTHGQRFNKLNNILALNADIHDYNNLKKIISEVDYVIHCFSATTPFSADSDPYLDINENLIPTLKILDICVQENIDKFVFISSGGSIYGNATVNKSPSENDLPLPNSPYGIIKYTSELYLRYYKAKHGLNYVTYRLSNPYGPRQITKLKQGVVPAFIYGVMNDETINIIGDGSSTRDYIFIKDAADIIAQTFTEAKENTYNLGSGQQTSVIDLLQTIEKIAGKKARTKSIQQPSTFVKSALLNVDKINNEFNLKPLTSLEEGLRMTIEQKIQN